MSAKRTARDRRLAGVVVRLTARDEALLRAVARFRLVRTSDLRRLFFDGCHRAVCAARLRRLFDGDYLQTHVHGLASDNCYSLGPRGRRWAEAQGLRVWPAPRGDARHHLALIHVWCLLAAAMHGHPELTLTSFTPDWQLRSDGQAALGGCIPDAAIEIRAQHPDQLPLIHRLALEVDRGTEWLPTLRHKIHGYAQAWRADGSGARPEQVALALVLEGATTQRAESIRRLLQGAGLGTALVWQTDEAVLAWIRGLAAEPPTPATHSRCGSGRDEPASPCRDEASAVTGGGPSEGR